VPTDLPALWMVGTAQVRLCPPYMLSHDRRRGSKNPTPRKEETRVSRAAIALLSPKTRCYRGCNKKGKKRMKGPEDDEGLAGKVALISGGGAAGDGIGNGRAAAILLARAGTKVMVADRELKLAERTAEMIREEGGTAAAIASDVTDEADCRKLVDATVGQFGRLDFLDNNVGIGSRGNVVDEKTEQYRKVMQVNVESMFLLSKYAIPAMVKTARGGAIVNISSISALRPRGLTTYTTSKAAVIGLSRAMAVDHGRDNIRVNCICPGPVYTPMVYARGMSDTARSNRTKASVLKLEGTGWDVGHAVKFLFSNYARYITGQVLVVDGGVTLQAPERESEEH
jgi:NAD(P)-dependent dehydrogenase (short-subunit alcohol dehydrogenase family)